MMSKELGWAPEIKGGYPLASHCTGYKAFSGPMNLAPSSFCKHQVKPGHPV